MGSAYLKLTITLPNLPRGYLFVVAIRYLLKNTLYISNRDLGDVMRLAYQLLKTSFLLWLLALSGQSFAVDTDNDGLPDDWEIANGRDPSVACYTDNCAVTHGFCLGKTLIGTLSFNMKVTGLK